MFSDRVRRHIGVTIAGLGVTQIISWGATYYLLTILAQPIGRDLAMSPGWVAAGMSTLMSVSALAGPYAGRLMDLHGAGPVMTAGSLISAIGLLMLSISKSVVMYFAAWIVIGFAGSMTLYPAAFTALTQIAPRQARRSITILTLPGGLASTVFWPLTTWLLGKYGWRETCLIYAAMQVCICLPIHLLAIPPGGTKHEAVDAPAPVLPAIGTDRRTGVFLLLATILALNSLLVTGTLNQFTHLLTVLGQRSDIVVLCAMMFGISQVSGRIVELLGGGGYDPRKGMFFILAGFAGAVFALGILSPMPAGGIIFAVLFGICNGLFTINRSAVILFLFGSTGFGYTTGKITVAQGVTGAAAPIILATTIDRFGGAGGVAFLGGVASAAVVVMLALLRHSRDSDRAG